MTYVRIARIARWVSRIAMGLGVFAFVMSLIAPPAVAQHFVALTLQLTFGSLMNVIFAMWCEYAIKHQTRENRRKQWLKDTKR